MNFSELNIISPLEKALIREWFTTATEIQEKVIPYAIENKDILWVAQTGSGKTLAFCLPVLQNMYNNRLEKGLIEWKQKRIIKTLILAPTRELAIQIWETFSPYCTNVNFKHTVINGWMNQFHQVKAIEKWVDILIATPGRLLDLISQWVINISHVENFVIDEADKLLEMWFMVDVKKIIKWVKNRKQTLFFSATMPKEIKDLASGILNNPERITINPVLVTTDSIKQELYYVNQGNKRQLLQYIIKRKDLDSIIVFTNTKDTNDVVSDYISLTHIKTDSIHRWKTQNQRQRALKSLKNREIKVLVATDIASRWLDISSLSCVINYDIPRESETYVHRIWRTGRAWKEGLAISFWTKADSNKIKEIEKLIWKEIWIIDDNKYKKEEIPKSKYTLTTSEFKKVKAKQKRHYWSKKK